MMMSMIMTITNISSFIHHYSFTTRRKSLRSAIIEMGKELQANDNNFFFPLVYIVDVLLSFMMNDSSPRSDIAPWLVETLTEAGISHAAIVEVLLGLVHKNSDTNSLFTMYLVVAHSLEIYSDFIIHHNIDPMIKSRFVASLHHYDTVLSDMEEKVQNNQAGNEARLREEVLKQTKKVRSVLKKQKRREESILYGQMLI